MDKESFKSFLGWLETASNSELLEKQKRLVEFHSSALAAHVKADARRLISLIDEELLARAAVQKGSDRKQS